MKLRILSFYNFITLRARRLFLKNNSNADLEKEIESLKKQLTSLYEVVREQSTIIVTVARIQSDLSTSISKIENKIPDEDYFLIKIPLRNDGIAN